MNRMWISAIAAAALAVSLTGGALAEEAAPAAKAATPAGAYVGPAKCKMCHNSPTKGEQYKVWAATKHAQAFAVLASPEAAEVAKKAGVSGNPQEAPQCLACHTTGAAARADLRAAIKPEDGVSCEACHGAGAQYASMSTMKAVFAGAKEPASVGLSLPDEKTCTGCHNAKSPTFKAFDYAKMHEKIKHLYPEATAKLRGRKA